MAITITVTEAVEYQSTLSEQECADLFGGDDPLSLEDFNNLDEDEAFDPIGRDPGDFNGVTDRTVEAVKE